MGIKVKKIFILIIIFTAFLFTDNGFTQVNIVKLNIPSLVFKNFYICYERTIEENRSVVLGLSYMPERKPPFLYLLSDENIYKDIPDNPFVNLKMNGFSITPEYRFYTTAHGMLRWFYLAPYLRYTNYWLKSDYIYEDDNKKQTDFYLKGRLTNISGGLMVGSHWSHKNFISVDWWMMGIGIMSSNLSLDISAEDLKENLSEIVEEEYTDYLGDFGKKAKYTETSDSSVEISLKKILPHIRVGFSIGIAL